MDKKQHHQQNCIFCQIVKGEIPAQIRMENENWLAFDDIHPSAPTHLLIIPKQHFDTLETITDPKIYQQLPQQAVQLAQQLGIKSYRLGLNVNPPNQEVMHLHLHLLTEEKV